MMSEISLLLKRGWDNIWKDKTLWLFGSLFFLQSLIGNFPIQDNTGLLPLLLKLVKFLIPIAFGIVSYIGILYILHCLINDVSASLRDTFFVTRKSFGRILFLFLIISIPLILFSSFVFTFYMGKFFKTSILLIPPLSSFYHYPYLVPYSIS